MERSPHLRESLPSSAHASRPWRIHEYTTDFRVEDVWALPTKGGPDDFPRLVRIFSEKGRISGARTTRALFAIRLKIGEMLGWDAPGSGLDARVTSIRDRLPVDLPESESGNLPFRPLYQLEDEWATEIANDTVHAVIHLGWVEEGDGDFRGQMAILVKPNGHLGSAYMAMIRPFRRLVVYPALLSDLEREWQGSHPAAVR